MGVISVFLDFWTLDRWAGRFERLESAANAETSKTT